jgi:B9 domain-containing protein 2
MVRIHVVWRWLCPIIIIYPTSSSHHLSTYRYIEWGKSWSLLEGEDSSQTQYAAPAVWNHPIDVHFASTSIREWPRIIVQVWSLDSYGRSMLAGYGFTHLPTNPGDHELEINCWKPTNGTIREKLQEFFLGTTPSCQLDEDVIFGKAWGNRSRLTTVSSGKVKLSMNVVLRFFNEHNVR